MNILGKDLGFLLARSSTVRRKAGELFSESAEKKDEWRQRFTDMEQ